MSKQLSGNLRSLQLAKSSGFLIVTAAFLLLSSAIHSVEASCKSSSFIADSLAPLPCPISPQPQWNDSEMWAWERICAGRSADFNKRQGNERLDSGERNYDDKWSNGHRTLTAGFLQTILTVEEYRKAIPDRTFGIRICGAYIQDSVHLDDISVTWPLQISESLFRSHLFLRRFHSTTGVSFSNSRFEGNLHLSSASIGFVLGLNNAQFNAVILRGLKANNTVTLNNSRFASELDMYDASINGSLLMRNTRFDDPVNLKFLSVASDLDARGSNLDASDFKSLSIVGSLRLGALP